MQQRPKKVIFVTLWVIGLTIGLISYIDTGTNAAITRCNEDSPLKPTISTNPNFPDQIYEGNPPLNENYNSSSTSYYYYCSALPIYYSLLWLYTVSSSNNFDVYLYADSAFSNIVGTSNTTNQLDWIVYRPPALTVIYPKTYTFTGSGEAYIQYEFSGDVSINTSQSISLSSVEYAEIRQIPLSTLNVYTVFLTMPAGSDYNLYVFRTLSGSAIRYDSYNSTSTSTGQYERIVFTPLYNDTYAIVITKNLGGGAATLTIYDYIYVPTSDGIPIFELFPVLIALAAIVFLYLTSLKKNNFLF